MNDRVFDAYHFNQAIDKTVASTQTRADKIRAMTDVELAMFLKKVGGCGPNFDLNYCMNRKSCEEDELCWLQWLKQKTTGNAESEEQCESD